MLKTSLFRKSVTLFLIIFFLKKIAEIFYFHWTLWWYDVILHSLSGGLIGLTIVLVWSNYHGLENSNKLKIITTTLLLAFIIGLLWEIFELYSGDTSFNDGIVYIRDTASDLIADVCGSFFGLLYAYNKELKVEKI
ncbi:MAG: hypothetical protein WAX85_01700 [Minisyncoccia bacterium]